MVIIIITLFFLIKTAISCRYGSNGTTEMLFDSLLPRCLLSTETDAYGNITGKTKDTTSQISIGATANPYACIYVDAIYLTGDKKTYTSLANLGEGGTTNYNGLTNKPKSPQCLNWQAEIIHYLIGRVAPTTFHSS